jgi:hypothetical protein
MENLTPTELSQKELEILWTAFFDFILKTKLNEK